jgi:hypothetical protein
MRDQHLIDGVVTDIGTVQRRHDTLAAYPSS